LLATVEELAARLGFEHIYCATSTSAHLLERSGWRLMERVAHDGTVVGIYEKALRQLDVHK